MVSKIQIHCLSFNGFDYTTFNSFMYSVDAENLTTILGMALFLSSIFTRKSFNGREYAISRVLPGTGVQLSR